MVSEAFFGSLFAIAGQSLVINRDTMRIGSALAMAAVGMIMLAPTVPGWVARLFAPFALGGNAVLSQISTQRLPGQFAVGAMMGVIWTPCVGPALGAAVTMASQASTRFEAVAMMIVFAIGASMPLLLLSYGSRHIVMNRIEKLTNISAKAGKLMGIVLIISALFILTGIDKFVESALTNATPEWWLDIITAF